MCSAETHPVNCRVSEGRIEHSILVHPKGPQDKYRGITGVRQNLVAVGEVD